MTLPCTGVSYSEQLTQTQLAVFAWPVVFKIQRLRQRYCRKWKKNIKPSSDIINRVVPNWTFKSGSRTRIWAFREESQNVLVFKLCPIFSWHSQNIKMILLQFPQLHIVLLFFVILIILILNRTLPAKFLES